MFVSTRAFLGLLGSIRDTLEQTTSANAGAVPVPLGQPLRQVFPSGPSPTRKSKRKRSKGGSGKVQDYSDLLTYAEHVERRLRSR